VVVDEKCQENVADPKSATADCHDQKKSLLKEGGKKRETLVFWDCRDIHKHTEKYEKYARTLNHEQIFICKADSGLQALNGFRF